VRMDPMMDDFVDRPVLSKWPKLGIAFFFLLVTVLNAGSIGVLDWFSTVYIRNWQTPMFGYFPPDMTPLPYLALQDVYEQRFSVHGRVLELQEQSFTAHSLSEGQPGTDGAVWVAQVRFTCKQTIDSNVWMGVRTVECSTNVDAKKDLLDPLDMFSSAANLCQTMCGMAEVSTVYTCEKLSTFAENFSDEYAAAEWEHNTICTAAKGVGAMMILAMMVGMAGFAMSLCCWHYPRVLVVPAAASFLLVLVGVAAYGAAVSTTYPRKALLINEAIATDYYRADSANSEIAGMRAGFGLAIASAVISLVMVGLVAIRPYIEKPAPRPGHRELAVLSGVPLRRDDPDLAAPPVGVSDPTTSRPAGQATAPELAPPSDDFSLEVADTGGSPRADVPLDATGDVLSGDVPGGDVTAGGGVIGVAGSLRRRLEEPAVGPASESPGPA